MTDFTKNAPPNPSGSTGTHSSGLRQQPATPVVRPEAPNAAGAGLAPGHQQSASLAQTDAARHELREKTVDLTSFSADLLKNQGAPSPDSANDFGSRGGKSAEQGAAYKSAGADYIGNIASAMQRAAREIEKDVPFAATYINKASAGLDDISNRVRAGNFSDLAREARAFVRRRPSLVVGLAVLAGFGVVRFFKASALTNEQRSLDRVEFRFQDSPPYGSSTNQSSPGSQEEVSKAI